MDIKGKRVLVVGLGKSGVASALFLRSHGAKVTVSDTKSEDQLRAEIPVLLDQGIAGFDRTCAPISELISRRATPRPASVVAHRLVAHRYPFEERGKRQDRGTSRRLIAAHGLATVGRRADLQENRAPKRRKAALES